MSRFRSFIGLFALLAATAFAPVLAAATAAPVDLNQATVEQLEQLDGIGAAKARAIVEFRAAHGPFTSVDDLREVRGIGDKLLAALRPHLSVGSDPAGDPPNPQ